MDKMNIKNRIIAINENENGFFNTTFSPKNYLHFLFEQTVDGLLVIPRIEENSECDFPTYYDCYDMNWSEKDCDALYDNFVALTESLKKIALGENIPEVYDVYVRPFTSEKFDKLITTELLEREFAGTVSNEEAKLLKEYHAAKVADFESRCEGIDCNPSIISHAQRLYKIYEIGAPSIIINNEEKELIESMALCKYALDSKRETREK